MLIVNFVASNSVSFPDAAFDFGSIRLSHMNYGNKINENKPLLQQRFLPFRKIVFCLWIKWLKNAHILYYFLFQTVEKAPSEPFLDAEGP
jgi:hypothetical protein